MEFEVIEALYAYNAAHPSPGVSDDDGDGVVIATHRCDDGAARSLCARLHACIHDPMMDFSDLEVPDTSSKHHVRNRATRMGYVEWTTRYWQWMMSPTTPEHVSVMYTTAPYIPTPAHVACVPWHFEKEGVSNALVDAQLAIVCALVFAPNRSIRMSADTGARRELVASLWSTARRPERRARTLLMPNGTGKTVVGLMWGTTCAMTEFDALRDVSAWIAGQNGSQSLLDPASHAVAPIFVYACTAMVIGQVLEEALGCARAWREERDAYVDVLPRDDVGEHMAFVHVGRRARAAAAIGGCVVLVVTYDELDRTLHGVRRQVDAEGKHMLPLALYLDDDDGHANDGGGAVPRVLYGSAVRRPRWPMFERKEDSKALLQRCAEFASQDVASHFVKPLIHDLGTLSTRGLVRFEIAASASNPLIRALDHPEKDPTFKLSIVELCDALRLKGNYDDACTRVDTFVQTVHEALDQGARTTRAMSYAERRRLILLRTLVNRLNGETAVFCPICFGEMGPAGAPSTAIQELLITPCCAGLICASCKAACFLADPRCPRCRHPWGGPREMACDQVVAHALATPIVPPYAPTATTFDELVHYVETTDLSALADHPAVMCALLDEVCAVGITLVILAWQHGADSVMGRALDASGHAVHYMLVDGDVDVKKRTREGTSASIALRAARHGGALRTRGSLMVLVTTPARVQCVDMPYARVLVYTGCRSERDEVRLVGRMLRPQPRNCVGDGKLVIKVVT